jgi:hypothetical protein
MLTVEYFSCCLPAIFSVLIFAFQAPATTLDQHRARFGFSFAFIFVLVLILLS